ncbi:MAG: hypothetical protein OEY44_03615 [Candidatus Peregrinibacteria bacterium]|nr:hypothetical protein [Candidatus Peregrinibacteria bacterium]
MPVNCTTLVVEYILLFIRIITRIAEDISVPRTSLIGGSGPGN